MSRTQRLLDLLQLLRQHRFPIRGIDLACQLGVSLRTLYRDIASLQAQGASIEGEPGLGYVLRPGYLLPPLMFSAEELEALVLGSRWVAKRGDSHLQLAAQSALAKIGAVLPSDLRDHYHDSGLLIGPGQPIEAKDDALIEIRKAIRKEYKIALQYRDVNEKTTERTLWPFALGFFEQVRIIIAWCELRQDIRCFRVDRIQSLTITSTRYPIRRANLLRTWRTKENIPPS